jgi:hypothetical protein
MTIGAAAADSLSRRQRILGSIGIVCLAFAATRATDLLFYEPGLTDWAGPQGSFDIVRGRGVAPEQYRYLSHLLVALIAHAGGFKLAVNALAFLSLVAFFFIVLFVAWPERPAREKAAICAFVALLYPLSMLFGARFDTGLFLAFMMLGLCLWDRPLSYLLVIVAFSVARADYALMLALFVLTDILERRKKGLAIYVAAGLVPLAVQILFWNIFAGSAYYTKIATLSENLHGEFLKTPGFWYTLGAAALISCVALNKEHRAPAGQRAKMFAMARLAMLGFYLLAILVVGRLREWRLLLPVLPLLLVFLWGPARQMIGATWRGRAAIQAHNA